jgi:hypothetical protein
MYTVGSEKLPDPETSAETAQLMAESLAWYVDSPYAKGVGFTGEVYQETDDPDRFEVIIYVGRVTSMMNAEPPAFNLLVDEASKQIGACDCPYSDTDLLEDFELAMEETRLSQELDELAGTPTVDPHFEAIAMPRNTEVTIRFDRLGWHGVNGVIKSAEE